MNATRIPVIASLVVRARLDFAWACVFFSRILLVVAAIELITMPLTQYLWTWDHFLHGGRDFEIGLLLVVTFLCFVLLRAQDNRQHMESLLAIGMPRSSILQRREHRRMTRDARSAGIPETDFPASPASLCNTPLLI